MPERIKDFLEGLPALLTAAAAAIAAHRTCEAETAKLRQQLASLSSLQSLSSL